MEHQTQFKVGAKVLITTQNWFLAPDGREYRAVHGTIKAVRDSKASLGLDTNRNSTNWYVEVGNMMIAGCQIFYLVAAPECQLSKVQYDSLHEGKYIECERRSRIYNADVESMAVQP